MDTLVKKGQIIFGRFQALELMELGYSETCGFSARPKSSVCLCPASFPILQGSHRSWLHRLTVCFSTTFGNARNYPNVTAASSRWPHNSGLPPLTWQVLLFTNCL